jgi:hypothetical protein
LRVDLFSEQKKNKGDQFQSFFFSKRKKKKPIYRHTLVGLQADSVRLGGEEEEKNKKEDEEEKKK